MGVESDFANQGECDAFFGPCLCLSPGRSKSCNPAPSSAGTVLNGDFGFSDSSPQVTVSTLHCYPVSFERRRVHSETWNPEDFSPQFNPPCPRAIWERDNHTSPPRRHCCSPALSLHTIGRLGCRKQLRSSTFRAHREGSLNYPEGFVLLLVQRVKDPGRAKARRRQARK